MSYRQVVGIAAWSAKLSADEMAKIAASRPDSFRDIGRPQEVSGIPSRFSTWEVFETSNGDPGILELIDKFTGRIPVIRESIVRLYQSGCEIHFELVQYIPEEREGSPSFTLAADLIAFLASVRASVSIDLYVL